MTTADLGENTNGERLRRVGSSPPEMGTEASDRASLEDKIDDWHRDFCLQSRLRAWGGLIADGYSVVLMLTP